MKSPDEILNGVGRWDASARLGKIFHSWYNKPKLIEALKPWEMISDDSSISKADLSYGWVAYHSQLGEGTGSHGE